MSNKMSDDDGRVARMKDMLSKGGGGMPGLLPPKPRPKPKAKPKPVVATPPPMDTTDGENRSPASPDSQMDNLPPIVLNTDSLRDFSETLDYDFDVVTRHQILDSSAQKDRAALSQSKGLQNRRLPKNLASKVPEDYNERRRAHTYSGNLKRPSSRQSSASPSPAMDVDSVDGPLSPEISEDERKQKNLAKLGVQQSNNPLAALGSILKRSSSGRGSFSRKKKPPGSPSPAPKAKKTSLDVTSSPVPSRLGSEPPQSNTPPTKSPKGFLRGLRRNSSRKKKEGEDLASETSSVVSLPIHSPLDEAPEPRGTSPAVTPAKSFGTPSSAKNNMTSTPAVTPAKGTTPSVVKANGGFSPAHTASPHLVPLRDKEKDKRSPLSNRKTTDSAIFRESSYENLFGSDSNLFDNSELDAFFKKEKTPEKIDEEKADLDSPDRAPSPMEVTSRRTERPPPIVTPVVPLAKKKQSVDSPRMGGMRANLHRYESNSSVSKTDVEEQAEEESVKPPPILEDEPTSKSPTFVDPLSANADDAMDIDVPKSEPVQSPSRKPEVKESKSTESPSRKPKDEEPPPAKSPAKKPKVADSPSKGSPSRKPKFAEPSSEKKTIGSPLRKPKVADPPRKKPKVADPPAKKADKPKVDDKPSPKRLSSEDSSSKAKVNSRSPATNKKPLLFEEEEDDLFGPPLKSGTKKEEADEKAIKKASLFSDESSELFVEKEKSTKVAPKDKLFDDVTTDESKKEKKIETEDIDATATKESTAKKTHDLFGDSIDSLDEKVPEKKDESEKKEKDTTDIFGETPLFKDISQKPKHSNLFEDDDDEKVGESGLFSGQEKVQKPSQSAEENDDSLFDDINPKNKPKLTVTDTDISDPLGAVDIEVTSPSEKPEVDEVKAEAPKEEIPAVESIDTEDKKAEKPAKADADSKPSASKEKTTSPAKGKVASKTEKSKDESGDGKPSWMAELKKRKQSKGTEGSMGTPKKEPEEPPMPEWKKRALERKKKAESGGSASPKPGRTSSPSKSSTTVSKSPLKPSTTDKKSPLSDRKSPGGTDSPSTRSKYKTRQEREREAKERKEKEEKEMEEIRLKYRKQREEEREKRLKEKKEEGSSRYKTRREREREAKEKEEQEKKEKEEQEKKEKEEQEKKEKEEKPTKDDSDTKTPDSEVKSAEPKSPSKPALAKKPSIEIISKKISSTSSKSFDATDEGKPPARKDSEGSKKDTMEDDVFSTGDSSEQRSASSHSLRRTPSPKISIETISTVSKPAKDVVENGHSETSTQAKPSDNQEAKETTPSSSNPTSPTHNGSNSGRNSSASSERDVSDSKPYRSHSQSISVSSRSPTPPLIPSSSSDSIPEWKKKLMEKKKLSSPVHKVPPKAVDTPSSDAGLPQWKKELLAKKKTSKDSTAAPRSTRSATVATSSYGKTTGSASSSRRSKEPAPTPDFMKEFQKKKQRNS